MSGMQLWDNAGRLHFDAADFTAKVMGQNHYTTDAGNASAWVSFTFPKLANQKPFAFDFNFTANRIVQVKVTDNGSTALVEYRCLYPYPPPAPAIIGSYFIIFGVY